MRQENWLEKICPIIQERIETYSRSEIRFNLLGLIKNRVDLLQSELTEAKKRKMQLEETEDGQAGSGLARDGNGEGSNDGGSRASKIAKIEGEISNINDKIAVEEEKRKAWKDENIRRKHNYIPFLFNFLKILAEKNKLKPLIEKAQELQTA
mmetsp:Transcript_11458/g.29093  ORF Transcript_11458/g.29093 Transcript_11458/m.29093 type:complete len:152 (+) Transcript_11458:506-961(+)